MTRYSPKIAQVRIFAAFFLYAFSLGGIFTRLGDIQLSMGILQGALGLAVMGIAMGTQITLLFAGKILDVIGHKNGLLILIPMIAIIQAIASLSDNPVTLFWVLFVSGFAVGTIEVIINLEADRIEHQIGKRIMNRSHGFWSFGFFFAGIVGAGAKHFQLSPTLHIGIVALATSILVVLVLKDFEPAPKRSSQSYALPMIAIPTSGIMVLVAFTLSAMMLEGASTDWSIIYMRDVFQSGAVLSTLAFSLGAFFQGSVRFFADGFVDRYGPQNVGRTMIILLLIGTLLVSFAPHPLIALFGFSIIGAGASTIFPLAMSAAAQRTDRAAEINVASLAQISFITFLVAPPLLGFVGEAFGMRAVFGIGLPLVLLSWVTLHSLGPDPEK